MSKDTIYREDAIKAINASTNWYQVTCNGKQIAVMLMAKDVNETLEKVPSADRPQGEWIYHEDWKNDGECPYECSECGTAYDYDMNFCGYCGARMHSGEATKVVENCENCKHYTTCKESCGGDRWERSE